MKSAIWKSIFCEIKESKGRFIAILAIVALGVGFFAGLKVTQTAMLQTTEQYLDENEFYDFRILSTVGFSEDEVERFRGQEDVKAAEGAVFFDVLFQDRGGNEKVIRAHSITSDVNRLTVTKGRLPETKEECVVDANLCDASWIGRKIKLSEENDETDLKHFACNEYKITGLVQSPCYIQFERGNTSLGNGRVSGFMYLLPEGFTSDYSTEIYVRFADTFPMYSDAYDTYIEEKTAGWEALVQESADERYKKVRREAEEKLSDGKKELSDKSAEAEEKLADAKQTLDRAEEEIKNGETQLADAKKKLEEAPEQLEAQEKKLSEAEETVLAKEKELDMGEIALGVAFSQGMNQISGAMSQGADSLFGQQSGNNGAGWEINAGSGTSGLQEAGRQMQEARQQLADGKEQLEKAKQEIEKGKEEIKKAKQQLVDGEKEWKEKNRELLDAKEKYEEGRTEYEEALEKYRTETADARQKIADGEKALEELKTPETYVLGRDTNVGYVCFESDSGIVDGIAGIFPVFFFLVAALVCITTMNRMVEEQRTQIGVLKALGYSEGIIMQKYMFYSGSAAVLGCLLGFAGGTYFFPKVIWYAYGLMYRVDSLIYVFDWRLAAISLAVSLLCSVGTTWISCRCELSEAASELMRPKAPKVGKRVILEYLPFVWKRLKFLQKVSARNIFRYKKRFFMMLIGISGCTALLVTGFGVRDSIANVASQQYTEIQTYDISVTYSKAADVGTEEELAAFMPERISDCAFVLEKTVDLEVDGEIKSVNLVVADPQETMQPFLNLHTTDKEPISYPKKDQAVISHKVAADYGVRVGDTIRLRDENRKVIEAEVSGINENFVYNYVYLSSDTYEEQLGEVPEHKTVYINAAEGQDAHLLSTSLMTLDSVAAVNVSADIMERFSGMMKSLDLIVVVIILCAAGLAFIVLYNLTNINITERIREIATIKVLGFYENETAAYVFRENTVLAFLGALLGLVLGHFLHRFVMSQIKIDMVTFDAGVRALSFVYSVVLTMGFAWFVSQMMRKKIDHISMTESLKSVD